MCSRVIGRSSAKGVCVGRGWWLVDNDLLFVRSKCIGSALGQFWEELHMCLDKMNLVVWRKAGFRD